MVTLTTTLVIFGEAGCWGVVGGHFPFSDLDIYQAGEERREKPAVKVQ